MERPSQNHCGRCSWRFLDGSYPFLVASRLAGDLLGGFEWLSFSPNWLLDDRCEFLVTSGWLLFIPGGVQQPR